MGKECIVVGCCNRDTDKQIGLKFHRLPKDEKRRKLWLKAINRKDPVTGKDWIPGDDGARVCSEHFIQGKSDDPISPDYVPSVNLGYHTPMRTLDRFNRTVNRTAEQNAKRQLPFQDSLSLSVLDSEAAEVLLGLSSTPPNHDNKENSDKGGRHDTCIKLLAEANIKTKQVMQELNRLTLENDALRNTTTKLRFNQLSEEEVKFYTGLPSTACYQWLLGYVEDILPKSTLMTAADILLLTLMKIRLNSPQKDLAFRFGVSETSVTSYIDATVPVLAKRLVFLIRWPGHEEIIRTRPQCFKDTFPKCVSIIDCTEVFIDSPADFAARNATYSTYKHAHTLKFFVSITPAGTVSFISQAYPGKTSDKILANDCGYFNFIEHGNVVLADRGFLISDELNELGAELVIPAFTRGKMQLSARDVEKGRKISNVRIHVERAMERLKNFRILSEKMHSNIVPHADSIMTICAGIVNLHPSLVS